MEQRIDLSKLFKEKKYKELIFLIENKIPDNQKNSGILNVLGVCKLLKGKANKQDLSDALNDFRSAYLKEKNTNHSKEAFINFINVSIDLFEYENSQKNYELSFNNFKEITKFFEDNQDYFLTDVRAILAVIRIYKRIVDVKKVNFYLDYLVKRKKFSPFILNNYIYYPLC